jgi:DNA replicative helicase MCM subunit Mcm2 (Cdc46/Mcm family)
MQEAPGVRGRYSKSGVNDQAVMTPRQLLSILRLSQVHRVGHSQDEAFLLASYFVLYLQALARIRLASRVTHEDVDEAIRLVSTPLHLSLCD